MQPWIMIQTGMVTGWEDKMNIREELGKRMLFFDGGLGSLLQARGLKPGELPETWNLSKPEELLAIHKEYLEAGADIILANTFGANRFKYDHLQEIVEAAVKNAKKAAEECGRNAYVALDLGPTGKLLKPMGTLDFEEAVSVYAEVVKIGAAAGADLILIETMSDTYELKAAVLAAKENSDLPVVATVVFDESHKMLTGASPEVVVAMLEGLRVDALGMNCGLGPKQMKPIFEKMAKLSSLPLVITPNAGLPRTENGKTVYDVDPEEFAADVEEIIRMGAWMAGGCCGTTPAHIKALTERCKDIVPKPLTEKEETIVTSYSMAVELGEKPMIIGERINPTGKSKFKQALRYQNMEYIEKYNPEYVLILGGDHIYKMDYEVMLDFHKEKGADVTIAVMPVPMEEAKRFGIMITDEDHKITDFEEKPEHPRSNLASMGIYIFNWKTLKEALIAMADQPALDFGKHIIPYCHEKGMPLYAYEYNGYWKDVGTLSSYWEANMELIDIIPEFNLYEEYWKIYTNSANLPPQYISEQGVVDKCLIGNGSEIYGEIHSCVVGGSVTIGKGTVIRDSIIMQGVTIGENCVIDKAIIAEDTVIGDEVSIGIGSEAPNKLKPNIYSGGLATIGEKSVIPSGVQIGKNTAISGVTSAEDYVGGVLESGETLIKAGERV